MVQDKIRARRPLSRTGPDGPPGYRNPRAAALAPRGAMERYFFMRSQWPSSPSMASAGITNTTMPKMT